MRVVVCADVRVRTDLLHMPPRCARVCGTLTCGAGSRGMTYSLYSYCHTLTCAAGSRGMEAAADAGHQTPGGSGSYVVMACIVMALYSCGLYSYALHGYGLYSHGL